MPETRYEILDGRVRYVSPAKPPHARLHGQLAYVLRAHVAPGYVVAVDMLTRTSALSDFAPDASIYPEAPDPETGGRRLEELAFEIASTQRLVVVTRKAKRLTERGVRRIFCLRVKTSEVLAWDARDSTWSVLAPDTVLEDRCLLRPLPVRALVLGEDVDNEVAAALLARRTKVLETALREGNAKGRAEGEAKGRAEAILLVLSARGIPASEDLCARIRGCTDLATLDRWLSCAGVVALAGEILTTG